MTLNPIPWLKARSKWQKLALVAGIMLIGYVVWSQTLKADDVSTYQFATVETGNITQTVSETGEVTASNKTDVLSTINGIVTQVDVENGQQVTRGDQLFYVQSTATAAERSNAWSNYLSAQANLVAAQASQYSLQSTMFTEWDQYKELAESDTYEDTSSANRDLPEFQSPQKDWLAAEANYKNQETKISQTQAALNKAWLDYQAMTDGPVLATADGLVQNLSVAQSQQVKTTDTTLIITSPSETWVKVGINENDILNVQPGQTAEITIDALNGSGSLTGKVQRVDAFGTNVSEVIVYYVYLTIDNPNERIRPGMTTQVDIITHKKENVLVVPKTAIRPYQGEKAVQTLDETTNAVIYLPVTLGISDDTNTEVVSGVSEGQQIITSSTATENSGGGFFAGPR